MSDAPSALPLVPAAWLERLPSVPVLSSEGLGWRHLCVYRVPHPARFTMTLPATRGHLVSCHLNNPCDLGARWHGYLRRCRSLPGDTIIMAAQQENRWEGQGAIDELQIFLDPELLMAAGAEIGDRSVLLRQGVGIRDPLIQVIGARLLEELAHPSDTGPMVADAMAHALAAQLISRHSNLRAVDRIVRLELPAHRVRRAVEFIEANLGEELSIAAMAAAIGVSAFRFARGFHRSTGRTPHRFVLERRLERAQELLRSSELRVAAIAEQVGFSNHSHFAASFRRHCGCTPGEYRLRHRDA